MNSESRTATSGRALAVLAPACANAGVLANAPAHRITIASSGRVWAPDARGLAGRDVRILHRSGGHADFARRAAAHGLQHAVIVGPAIPPGPELANYYRASDICVQASREEGLGFSPLEALACGVPVVAAAVGGLRETIVHGHTGWTYPAGDAGALAGAIAQAMDDPTEARRRTELGRALVERQYEREAVFARFEAVVRSIVPAASPHDTRLAASV